MPFIIELHDAIVAGIGYIQIALICDDEGRIVERGSREVIGGIIAGAPLLHEIAVRSKLLDAIVAAVDDVDITVFVNGEIVGLAKLTRSRAALSPCVDKRTVGFCVDDATRPKCRR